MEKSLFKKCLQILDKIETTRFTPQSFYEMFLTEANEDNLNLTKDEIFMLYRVLTDSNNLEHYDCYFDLSQSFYIFGKSKHNSALEAYSLFESLIHQEEIYLEFSNHLTERIDLNKLDAFFIPIIKDTVLLQKQSDGYYFAPRHIPKLEWILEDIKKGLNCSDCLKVQYTNDLYHNLNIEYRNENVKIVDYENMKRMSQIYNKKGIPVDRDSSKDLQVFFKDCLFNEFRHACCVCGIDLPHMLIASHIKPFRDCGYTVEAMDSNNGLLLCRNHDYLFDQGYISFDDDGHILLTNECLEKQDVYNVHKGFILNQKHMTNSRKKFLEYHRNTYLKK